MYAGFDAGGTKTDVRVEDETGELVFEKRYSSGDFSSLDDLLSTALVDMAKQGIIPQSIGIGAAGPVDAEGCVTLTNVKKWPRFDPTAFNKRFGVMVTLANDMVATAAGLKRVGSDHLVTLKPGNEENNEQPTVITVSTGIGVSAGSPSEGGHMLWQPATQDELSLLQFLLRQYPLGSTVESVLGGHEGFRNLYKWLNRQIYPDRTLQHEIEERLKNGQDIGDLITTGAMNGDPHCIRLMRTYGALLGQFTRQVVVSHCATAIYFVGSVMLAPGVADYIVNKNKTAFLKRFIAEGSQHSDMMRATPIFLVTDDSVAVKGAVELARRAAQLAPTTA